LSLQAVANMTIVANNANFFIVAYLQD